MTWLIHKGDRTKLYNINEASIISLEENFIMLESEDSEIPLKFDTDEEAKQGFMYLRESIKRGDKLLNI